VPRAELHVQTAHGGGSSEVREGRGDWEFREHSEKSVEVAVSHARDRSGMRLPLGRARVTDVQRGQVVTVQLLPERTITGRVVDAEGRGVTGVKVRADPIDGPPDDADGVWREGLWLWGISPHYMTDSDGSFCIGQLGEGPHRLFVLPAATFAPEPSRLAKAGDADVLFTLRPATSVRIRVLDAQGRPVTGARVVAELEDANQAKHRYTQLFERRNLSRAPETDGAGEARLETLDAARRYVLGVQPPKGQLELAEHLEWGWAPQETEVRLGAGHTIEGRVVDAVGAPAPHVVVVCFRATGLDTQVTTSEAGHFRFDSLPAGPVRLQAYPRDFSRDRRPARATATAGDHSVVLRLDR